MAIRQKTVGEELQAMYGSPAELVTRARVTGRLAGHALRNCEVLIFALPDHPDAACCYVWEAEGRVCTALGIDSTFHEGVASGMRSNVISAEFPRVGAGLRSARAESNPPARARTAR
jgi:hypothetical protein